MIYFAVILTILPIFFIKNRIRSRFTSVGFSFLIFTSLLLAGFYLFANYLSSGNGIDESVLFHLAMDFEGAGLGDFINIIISAVAYLIIITSFSFYSYKLMFFSGSDKPTKKIYTLGLVFILISFYVNPGFAGAFNLYKTIASDHYNIKRPDDYISVKDLTLQGKNIVYIYLESVERTYFDEELFPDLMPNLKEIEQQALSFTDIRQIYGSGWTIAGKVSTQCGIPLVTPSGGNSMSGADKFLPDAVCIGDILNDNGYKLNYLGGASLDFAGKGNFYKTHQFDVVEGLHELSGRLENPEYRSSWGLYDDSLFELVKERFDELAKSPEPFGLFTLTVDTHHPYGHESSYCATATYKDGANPILNAVHCADKMTAELIEHVRRSDAYKNTIIVVSSDHLAMRNSAYDILQKGDRKNIFMILGREIKPHKNNATGASIDIASIILDILGADIEGFGFGRNLLKGIPSLTASHENVNTLLASHRNFFSSLWSFPQIRDGITVDTNSKELLLGSRSIKYPALLSLDKNLNVSSVKFDFSSPKKLIKYVSESGFDDRFIWVDHCTVTTALTFPTENQNQSNGFCLVYGALGLKSLENLELINNIEIDFQTIKKAFKSNRFEKTLGDNRIATLDSIQKYGVSTPKIYTPQQVLEGDFIITSAGYGSGASVIENLESKTSSQSKRGLTLFGLNAVTPPVEIIHLDTCASSPAQLSKENYSFQDDINKFSSVFGAFALVAHDSAICGNKDLSSLFEGTDLIEWDKIDFRTPYIAIVAGNGDVTEFTGVKESKVGVNAKNFIRPSRSKSNKGASIRYLPAVAHAGGGYQGKSYTNSLDALKFNSEFYELFEIDFSWTSDGHLVCLHDWEHSFKRSFNLEPEGKKTLSEFKSLVKSHSEFEKCTLESLTNWMNKNKHAKIVTDVKEANIKALSKIARDYPELQNRFIPQVYQPVEYYEAQQLGYKDIIWTLYSFSGDSHSVLAHLVGMNLYALTMPKGRANVGLAKQVKEQTGLLSYVHTINTEEEVNHFRELGIASIYTDFIPQPIPSVFDLRSAGYSAGNSYVTLSAAHEKLDLKRGLTLIGLSEIGQFKKLAHYDSCGSGQVIDTVSLDGSFSEVVSDNQSEYSTFAVLAHDSAVCGETNLEPIFSNTGLTEWTKIGFRTPYIGLILPDGSYKEMLGSGEQALSESFVVYKTDTN